jgi:hypothetical protein
LHHIVSNYDNLADWTVFSQADAPSFGYKGHREGGGHLVAGVTFDDYLTPRNDGAYFVYNQVVQLPSMHHSSRYSYFYETLQKDKGDVCPPSEDEWTPWWDLGWFVDFIADKVKSQGGMDALDFYQKYIDSSNTERRSLEIAYAQGARFALSRTVIQSQEKHVYERLLAELASNEDPWSGYYMEWMWADLFLGAGRAPCNAPKHGTAVSHPEMMEAVLRHFDLQTSSRSLTSGTSGISGGSTGEMLQRDPCSDFDSRSKGRCEECQLTLAREVLPCEETKPHKQRKCIKNHRMVNRKKSKCGEYNFARRLANSYGISGGGISGGTGQVFPRDPCSDFESRSKGRCQECQLTLALEVLPCEETKPHKQRKCIKNHRMVDRKKRKCAEYNFAG